MASICSNHADYKKGCRRCSSSPRALFADWDVAAREAECAGVVPCSKCHLGIYRYVTSCPLCGTTRESLPEPEGKVDDLPSILPLLQRLREENKGDEATGRELTRLVWLLPTKELGWLAVFFEADSDAHAAATVAKALCRRLKMMAAPPVLPELMEPLWLRLDELRRHGGAVVTDSGAARLLRHGVALVALLEPERALSWVTYAVAWLPLQDWRWLRNDLHSFDDLRGGVPALQPALAAIDVAFDQMIAEARERRLAGDPVSPKLRWIPGGRSGASS